MWPSVQFPEGFCAVISSNLALHAKFEEFENWEGSSNLRSSSNSKSGHPVLRYVETNRNSSISQDGT